MHSHADEALARALGDMYSEELASEQQLRELRSSGTQVPPLLRPSQPQRASQVRQCSVICAFSSATFLLPSSCTQDPRMTIA